MLDVSDLDKNQLAEYAKSGIDFDPISLDLRKGLAILKNEVLELQPKDYVGNAPVIPLPKEATHILNRDTGFWFPYTEALRNHLKNAVPCDSDGNPV